MIYSPLTNHDTFLTSSKSSLKYYNNSTKLTITIIKIIMMMMMIINSFKPQYLGGEGLWGCEL